MNQAIQKLSNQSLLANDPRLAAHLPVSKRLHSATLKQMLSRFSHLYLKPNNSCQGKGLMRIDRLAGHKYRLQTRDDQKQYTCTSLHQLERLIQQHKRRRPYLVQQGIESRTIDGRLYDIRVHLMRLNGQWQTVAMIGRVAPRQGIATNAYSGGIPVNIYRLLRHHLRLSPRQQRTTLHQLDALSLRATEIFSSRFPSWPEIGLDIGRDRHGHLWIYEINITPGLYVFRREKALQKRLRYLRSLAR